MDPERRPEQHAHLRALFEAHYEAVLNYARRRTAQLADAEDVVADTFVVAWRRLNDLPVETAERLPWLLGIARRILLNQRRSFRRRARLVERIRMAARGSPAPPSPLPPVMEAMTELSHTDQEILRLVAWEGLSHAEVAVVLGISANAAAIRLHRARVRLAGKIAKSRGLVKGSGRSRTWLGWKGSTSSPAEREEAR
jgi:DNA-directed RNA polymerase specialized sigma24 family protein